MKSPIVDLTGKPSWSALIVLLTMLLITVALCLVWFAPEPICTHAMSTLPHILTLCGMTVATYLARRWTEKKKDD